MKRPVKLALATFVILITASTGSAQQSPLLAIYNGGYTEAMKAGDAEKVNSFYAEDATILAPGAPPLVGRAAILKNHQNAFKRSGLRGRRRPQRSQVIWAS